MKAIGDTGRRKIRGEFHLIHPHRDQISTKLPTISFLIHQPVIAQLILKFPASCRKILPYYLHKRYFAPRLLFSDNCLKPINLHPHDPPDHPTVKPAVRLIAKGNIRPGLSV